MMLTFESQIFLTSTLSLYIVIKNTLILQTEVYFVPECNFKKCLWYLPALKIMFMEYLKNGN